MRLTEARIEAISQAIVDRLAEEELVDLTIDEEDLVDLVSECITRDLRTDEELQREAVEWLRVNRKHLQEGTSAWEIELDKTRHTLAIKKGYVLP